MLDWLNFRLGEIIGLIHAPEKRYYQNKTQLRYNFGSVYLLYYDNFHIVVTCLTCIVSVLNKINSKQNNSSDMQRRWKGNDQEPIQSNSTSCPRHQIGKGHIRLVWSEVFAVRFMGSLGPKLSPCGQRRHWSDWDDDQADPSLRRAHTPFCWFCHEAAQITFLLYNISQ